jgi:hypothetical protein
VFKPAHAGLGARVAEIKEKHGPSWAVLRGQSITAREVDAHYFPAPWALSARFTPLAAMGLTDTVV